jgi:hypothetical protein
MKDVVERVAAAFPIELEVVDISTDRSLQERYGLEIPVLLVNGRKAAKYRVSERELRQILDGRASGFRK